MDIYVLSGLLTTMGLVNGIGLINNRKKVPSIDDKTGKSGATSEKNISGVSPSDIEKIKKLIDAPVSAPAAAPAAASPAAASPAAAPAAASPAAAPPAASPAAAAAANAAAIRKKEADAAAAANAAAIRKKEADAAAAANAAAIRKKETDATADAAAAAKKIDEDETAEAARLEEEKLSAESKIKSQIAKKDALELKNKLDEHVNINNTNFYNFDVEKMDVNPYWSVFFTKNPDLMENIKQMPSDNLIDSPFQIALLEVSDPIPDYVSSNTYISKDLWDDYFITAYLYNPEVTQYAWDASGKHKKLDRAEKLNVLSLTRKQIETAVEVLNNSSVFHSVFHVLSKYFKDV
jgi:hypothetical protein